MSVSSMINSRRVSAFGTMSYGASHGASYGAAVPRPSGQAAVTVTDVTNMPVLPNATIGVPTDVTVQPINTPAKSAETQLALYNFIGPSIGFTGDVIKTAIDTNNQQQMARIQLATQARMAALQAQAQQAVQMGDFALASQKQQEAADLQQLDTQLSASMGSLIPLYIVAALMVAGIVGAVVYSRKESEPRRRSDRSSSRHRRSSRTLPRTRS